MSTADSRSPFRSRGFIVAAIIVGVIILAAIVVLVTSLARGGDNTATPAPSPSSPASASPATSAQASVCGLPGFETSSSLTAAPNNKWELVGTVAAPIDPAVGPGIVKNDGFRYCYAHTAEGALFAAVNYAAVGTDATLASQQPALVASGPGRDALKALSAQSSGTSTGGQRAQVAGFKIASYTADATTVDLALNYSQSGLVSLPLKLIWEEGDWKVVLTNTGQPPLAPAPLQNLGGYMPWGGA